jgi:DNA modification methylase
VILNGDVFEMLATLPANHVDCVVTSPPYWGLRDYGVPGQLGLEKTPDEYVGAMRMVFEQVRRVLKPEGTLWLNLGDSYAQGGSGGASVKSRLHGGRGVGENEKVAQMQGKSFARKAPPGFKAKDLVGIPWRVAFALQADGWYLRQDIIWHKPNPMPESVRDRCTKAHEYIFLLAKSQRYHFDIDAIKEPAAKGWANSEFHTGKTGEHQPGADTLGIGAQAGSIPWEGFTRQKRSVWTVTTKPFKGAHFATFPPDLIEPCILAGCPKDGIVLDPFFGAGTVGVVAKKHGRRWIGIELNKEYVALAEKRLA